MPQSARNGNFFPLSRHHDERLAVTHRPLSDFFLVYNERRNSLTGDLLDRALIAKFTYMISR